MGINVGDGWVLNSASLETITSDGHPCIQVIVNVNRFARGKLWSILLPALSVVFLDIAFHVLTPYENTHEIFLTSAVVAGVAVQMIDPSFLGIPGNLALLPFMQCFVLMIMIAGLKQMVLIVFRLVWTKRLDRL